MTHIWQIRLVFPGIITYCISIKKYIQRRSITAINKRYHFPYIDLAVPRYCRSSIVDTKPIIHTTLRPPNLPPTPTPSGGGAPRSPQSVYSIHRVTDGGGLISHWSTLLTLLPPPSPPPPPTSPAHRPPSLTYLSSFITEGDWWTWRGEGGGITLGGGVIFSLKL